MNKILKILMVSANKSETDKLKSYISNIVACNIVSVISGTEARRLCSQIEYDIAIISPPLTDEFGKELALFLSERTYSEVVFLCTLEMFYGLKENLERFGISVIHKQCDRLIFRKVILDCIKSRERAVLHYEKEHKVQLRSDEIRRINTAKQYLMKYMKFTEPQAHRYIEKKAMNTRLSRKQVASEIIEKFNSE